MACTDNENSGANFKDEMNEGTSFRTQTSNSNDWTDDETRENATRLLQSSNNHDLEQQINVDGPDENENEVTETRGVQTQETIDNMEFVGKEFATEDEADHFYHEYAKFVGFGVRRNTKRYDKQGMLTGRQWVCSKQGFRPQKYLRLANRSREARPLTRTGCRAEFQISLNERKTAWVCTFFYGKHNHNLTPIGQVHFIRSHRNIKGPDLIAASALHKVGVKPSQIHEYMVERSGGYKNVGFMRKDVQNGLDSMRRQDLKENDAETCLSYLEGKKSADPSFFYEYTIDQEHRLGDLFWCDGGARADYAVFGDVLAFDATYRTNAYRKPFVVFLGINHHRKSIVFGFALLSDEKEHTYVWLLQTFLAAMEGKQPATVITDGDRAMRNAIIKTFPVSVHRLCCWHLGRNAQANIHNTEFVNDFRRFMFQPYNEDEFNHKWVLMVQKHRVETNEWVKKVYEERKLWAEAYLKGNFFGGMRSTQRSEGMNAYLNHYVNRKLRLRDFVKQMDRLMDRQRESEGKDDFDSTDGCPILTTHLKKYEQQAADVYTKAVFYMVREEIDKEGLLTATLIEEDMLSKTYQVKKFGNQHKEHTVILYIESRKLSCTCMHYNSVGMPCSHSFVVMKAENLPEIPNCMILSRWRKDAKLEVIPSEFVNDVAQYMSVEARVGSIHTACRGLLKFVGKSIDAYNMAIIDIHKLSLRLEGMCSIAEPSGKKGERQRAPLVKDPVVVLTKGAAKKLKVRPIEQRKCKKCGEGGHTVRTCKANNNVRSKEPCGNDSNRFIFRDNVGSGGTTQQRCCDTSISGLYNDTNIMGYEPSNRISAALGTSSDILLQQNGDSMLGESLDHMQVDLIGSNFPNSQYSTTSDINDYINIWNYTDF